MRYAPTTQRKVNAVYIYVNVDPSILCQLRRTAAYEGKRGPCRKLRHKLTYWGKNMARPRGRAIFRRNTALLTTFRRNTVVFNGGHVRRIPLVIRVRNGGDDGVAFGEVASVQQHLEGGGVGL